MRNGTPTHDEWYDSLVARAHELLPDYAGRYFDGTADAGEAEAEAAAEWAAVRFAPRAFGDGAAPSTATTVLGTGVRTPVLIAPMGHQNAATPTGERATARAAAACGSLIGVSTITAVPFPELAETGAPWWFQLYPLEDEEATWVLVDAAVAAGARAIMLTVDLPTLASTGVPTDPSEWPDVPARERLANAVGLASTFAPLRRGIDPALIEVIARRSGLPVVLKGILRADDARIAVDAGASGIVVSTHGARRMGRSISALRALPSIVEAVGSRAEVYLDSGVRRGADVAAALALGARAVFVGRPVLWGLAAGGAEGAAAVLDRVTAEFAQMLRDLGASSAADLTPDMVWGLPTRDQAR
jgi:4-hydroxymandelate oxidase